MDECCVLDGLSRAETTAKDIQRSCRRRCTDHLDKWDLLAWGTRTEPHNVAGGQPLGQASELAMGRTVAVPGTPKPGPEE